MATNDNGLDLAGRDPAQVDPQGQAALVLVESLLHGLIERSVLSVDDGLDIIQTAIEVQTEVADAADAAGAKMWRSHALLESMAASLKHDAEGSDGTRPLA